MRRSLLRQSEWFRPRVGERVHSKETQEVLGMVTAVNGNICYFREPGRHRDKESNSYIWRFTRMVAPYGANDLELDCLNNLFYTWPTTKYRENL